MLLVALPVIAYDCSAALEVTQPGAIIMAGDDTFGTLEVLNRQLPGLMSRFHVEEIPGVDHFFTGKLDELRLRVRDWATSQLQTP